MVCVKCVGECEGEEDVHVNSTCNSVESSTHGLVPSVVGKAEVINFCVGSWADWTSLWGGLDWLDGSCFCTAAAAAVEMEMGGGRGSSRLSLSPPPLPLEIGHKLIQIRALLHAWASSLTFPPGRMEDAGAGAAKCRAIAGEMIGISGAFVLQRQRTCGTVRWRSDEDMENVTKETHNAPVVTCVSITTHSMSAQQLHRCLRLTSIGETF